MSGNSAVVTASIRPIKLCVQVADVCGVSAATVEATYAELHSELRDMLPLLRPPLTEEQLEAFPAPALKHMAKQPAA